MSGCGTGTGAAASRDARRGGLLGPLARRGTLDADFPLTSASMNSPGSRARTRVLGSKATGAIFCSANNGELLPGGGLVTAGGLLTVRTAKPAMWIPDSTKWKNAGGAGRQYIEPPGP